MEMNNPYDESLTWQPGTRDAGERQAYSSPYQPRSQYNVPERGAGVPYWETSYYAPRERYVAYQEPQRPARMPKAEALSLASMLKKTVLVVSLAAFGLLGTLIAANIQGASAASQSTTNSNAASPSTGDQSGSGNFFYGHRGGDGSYGFGNGDSGGGSSQSQSPYTRTGVS